MSRRTSRLRPLFALLATLLLLAGCSGATESDGQDSGGGDGAIAPEAGVGDDLAGERQQSDEDAADRSVIVTGSLSIRVADAIEAADRATAVVAAAGGRVDHRSEVAARDDEPATAYLTVRVPAEKLDATIAELEELGEPLDLILDRGDVTLQVRDLDARIRALELSVTRLETLMGQSGSVADLIAAESALAQRQAELDSLRSQRTYLGEQVALSTLDLALLPRETTPAPAPGGFLGGLVTGWTALVNTFNQAIVVLGVLVPWAVLAALVTGAVLLGRRRRRTRPAPAGSGQ